MSTSQRAAAANLPIATERLTLRAHRASDLDEALAMWSDPNVTRFIGGRPSTRQQTWARILGYAGHWSLLGFGYWAIEENASGRYVGELGFADFQRDIVASMRDVPELGWALASRAHGRGYGTEAVRAAVLWGDAHLSSTRTVCLIDAANVASINVAQKCGYRAFEHAPFNGTETIYFERLAPAGTAEVRAPRGA